MLKTIFGDKETDSETKSQIQEPPKTTTIIIKNEKTLIGFFSSVFSLIIIILNFALISTEYYSRQSESITTGFSPINYVLLVIIVSLLISLLLPIIYSNIKNKKLLEIQQKSIEIENEEVSPKKGGEE